MIRDHIARVLREGLPVQGVRWLRRCLREGDPVARSIMHGLVESQEFPVLPGDTEEARWLQQRAGAPLPGAEVRAGAYALGTVPGPTPGDRIGCVRWVSFEHGSMLPKHELFFGVEAAYRWLIAHDATSRGQGTCSVTLRRADRPEQHIARDARRKSAGLAAALATAIGIKNMHNETPGLAIAATGEVNSTGDVLKVDNLAVKLKALVREAPHIRTVCIPQVNAQQVPGGLPSELEVVPVGSIGEAFEKVLNLTGIRPAGPALRAASAAPSEDLYEAALAIPLGGGDDGSAFSARLLRCVQLHDCFWDQTPPGWRREVKTKYYSYFGRLHRTAPPHFLRATQDILAWRPHEGKSLPAVYTLESHLLRDRTRARHDGLNLTLESVDLIPFNSLGARVGMLGFRVRGSDCTVGQYLRWAAARAALGKLELRDARGNPPVLTLGGLFEAMEHAVLKGAELDLEAATRPISLGDLSFTQCMLLPKDHPWPEPGAEPADPVFELAWRLLATQSRPRPGYPKGSEKSLLLWDHPDAKLTRFAMHRSGFSVLSHASDEFNRTSKFAIVDKALYLQWLVVTEMRNLGLDPKLLYRAHKQEVRAQFARRCWEFLEDQE